MAAGKAPMQASTEGGGVPQRALDGSTSAVFSPDTCTLSKPERVPWWYVNLLEPYMVQLVRLDFGKPCCGEFSCIALLLTLPKKILEGMEVLQTNSNKNTLCPFLTNKNA